MRGVRWFAVSFVLYAFASSSFASDVTPLQMLFTVKQVFPEQTEVAVFISKGELSKTQKNLTRASAQTHLKTRIFIVENSSDIGNALSQLQSNTVLVLFDSPRLAKNKSKLYILSKCKAKHIAIVTSSVDYAESGALLGVVKGADQKVKTILNLKHNAFLRNRFTDDMIARVGIQEVIR